MIVDCGYTIRKDLDFVLSSEDISTLDMSENLKISRKTIEDVIKNGKAANDTCEKIYSYIYGSKYRINSVKEELAKEKYHTVLFHGSKQGLSEVNIEQSRGNCDFGKGFYLGETYNQAISFVCQVEGSSVYSFQYSLKNLKVKKFECDLDWMIAICYYRGKLGMYTSNPMVSKVISEVESADVVIAPIADNRMFYIMTQFTDGEINADVALHSLSASKLGLQYVFKTDKALSKLKPLERYFLCEPERKDCVKRLDERGYEIDTKLKLAKREFRTGLYIEELLK